MFVVQSVDEVTVYVPTEIRAQRRPMRIALTCFLGIKRLVLEGWSPL
jgi:hypothetical protein